VYVYPGVSELLKAIQQQGVPMALCTGKSRRAVEISLQRLAWGDYFKVVVTGDDTTRFKPDPEGLNLILGQIRAARGRTIFIGDLPADTTVACNAGVVSGRAEWGMSDHAIFANPRPDYQFATPQAVIDLIGR
jgi:HAD superfamily hydrolase (TIGR01549 family)